MKFNEDKPIKYIFRSNFNPEIFLTDIDVVLIGD